MANSITNYDGSITTTPQVLAEPTTVAEIQAILRQPDKFPSPVRAMGSFHSLTPCAASTGTIVRMTKMERVIKIDPVAMTFTAEAGLEMIEANKLLRKQKLQFMLNIEIGNLTLGSAACCHTKDSLDAVEFGQVNSYVTAIKWVTPSGELQEASADKNPELLPLIKSSYGLAGIIYEVTFKIKPLEIVSFDYEIHEAKDLTEEKIAAVIAANQGVVCWTIGDTVVIQTRNQATELKHEWLAGSRRFGWNFLGAFASRLIRQTTGGTGLGPKIEEAGFDLELGFYRLISKLGGFTLYDPDKMIDYSKTPAKARYAFTFWTFPRKDWVKNLHDYLEFAEAHFAAHGFRCNLPLGAYFVRKDTSSLLSYTFEGDMMSLDPIHAPSERDSKAWAAFLVEFNAWAQARGGRPLLNQSPFVTKAQVAAGYGDRWQTFSDWVKSVDPDKRMVNSFFADLLA
jgi:FAD/FMN-containing dehydrogenase